MPLGATCVFLLGNELGWHPQLLGERVQNQGWKYPQGPQADAPTLGGLPRLLANSCSTRKEGTLTLHPGEGWIAKLKERVLGGEVGVGKDHVLREQPPKAPTQ